MKTCRGSNQGSDEKNPINCAIERNQFSLIYAQSGNSVSNHP